MEITILADCRQEDLASTLTLAVAVGGHMTQSQTVIESGAADFENKARLTSDHSAKIAYFELAHAYLQLKVGNKKAPATRIGDGTF